MRRGRQTEFTCCGRHQTLQVPRRMAGMQVLPISVLPTLCLCRWSKSAILCE